MRIDGEWYPCPDHVTRPVIRGEVLGASGLWVQVPFLVDTGADRTVFSAHVLARLGRSTSRARQQLGGVGGRVDSVLVEARIFFSLENGGRARFNGPYAALTSLDALDMSVLGRDVTDQFAVIVDQPGNTVCLLNQRHRYLVSTT